MRISGQVWNTHPGTPLPPDRLFTVAAKENGLHFHSEPTQVGGSFDFDYPTQAGSTVSVEVFDPRPAGWEFVPGSPSIYFLPPAAPPLSFLVRKHDRE